MLGSDIKIALSSLKTVKWRSSLTILGIVIGIVSVVTIVSLGNGIKQQVNSQVEHAGSDLITIRPGQALQRDENGNITNINLAYSYGFGAGSLNDNDLAVVANTPGVDKTTPLNLLAANVKNDDKILSDGLAIGTSTDFPSLINQKLEFGTFFGTSDTNQHVAIIGKYIADRLFQESIPIGRTITVRGQDFVVRGIFEKFQPNTLALGSDFNKAVFIPYLMSKQINDNTGQIVQILAKPSNPREVKTVADAINRGLLDSHGGQNDFTVLTQRESLALNKGVLNILTGFVSSVAAIALLVAGIGIMNIMLVSVTERTREIGIRKALGATNRQLLTQFWVEAITLSLIGGLFGVVFSVFVNYLIRIFSNLTPVITWPVVVLASGVSIIVGIAFGMIPAFKAARKDPIEALRHET